MDTGVDWRHGGLVDSIWVIQRRRSAMVTGTALSVIGFRGNVVKKRPRTN